MSSNRSDNPTWVQWYANDALAGCVVLTAIEECAYRRILDMIFVSDDRLRDDDRIMPNATKAGRQWRAVRDRLIELGKIDIQDGFIRNGRATKTCDDTRRYRAQKTHAATASHAPGKRLKNHDMGSAAAGVPQAFRSDPAAANQQPQKQEPSLRSGSPAQSSGQQAVPPVRQEAKGQTVAASDPPLPRDLLSGSVAPPKAKGRAAEPDGFSEWYTAYPRHVARAEAAKAYPAACSAVGGPKQLLALTKAHRFTDDAEFIPYPASWLRGQRWNDAPLPLRQQGTVVPFRTERPADDLPKSGSGEWIKRQKAALRARAQANGMTPASGPIIDGQAEQVG